MIRITRRQSIIIATVLLVSFFAATVAVTRSRNRVVTRPPDPEEPIASPTPVMLPPDGTPASSSQFVLGSFHRSEIKDGKKLWEVKADRGQYFPETASAVLESATVWMYRKDRTIQLSAPHAALSFRASDLKNAQLHGGIRVEYDDSTTVETDAAVYDKEHETLTSDSGVRVSSDSLDVTGKNMFVNLTNNEVRLTGGVTTVVKPRK